MSTTHLALSEPRGAPVTSGEPSPLGRRRTRGLFVREGERELACNDLIGEVPGVAQAVGAFRGNDGPVVEEPVQSERKVERDDKHVKASDRSNK